MNFQPIKSKKIYEEIMEQIESLIVQGDLIRVTSCLQKGKWPSDWVSVGVQFARP